MECLSLILAAGEGVRMKSARPKVMHCAAGQPLVKWVMDAAKGAAGGRCVLVCGHGAQEVRDYFGEQAEYVLQPERKGSGHAVMCAAPLLEGTQGYVLVVCGDMPLITEATLRRLIETAVSESLDAALLTAELDKPEGYGRIVRGKNGRALRIVEQKDANEEERRIREANAGCYCFKIGALLDALKRLRPANSQGEYYLTDCIEWILEQGGGVRAVQMDDPGECAGVNDRVQLAAVSRVLRRRILDALMRDGVTVIDPDNTYVDAGVTVGRDTVIYPGVVLEGRSAVGSGCTLYPGSRICDSVIGEGTDVQNSVILQSAVGAHTTVGPYAYLRPHSEIGDHCRIGDFVEVKNARIMDGAKVPHLSYIGDGHVGENSNIGCGVVFVNYDGAKKHRTVVQRDVFVGCNANLIAPVEIGCGAYIAAGSTVTEDVPENALCIARARQVNKADWKRPKKDG